MRSRIWIAFAVLAIGVAAFAAPSATTTVVASCGGGYYENSDGQCIPDPSSGLPPGGSGFMDAGPPAGATAICRDGNYSFSTHHSGTCSGHGGVRQWLGG